MDSTFDRLMAMMDEILNPPQEVPRVIEPASPSNESFNRVPDPPPPPPPSPSQAWFLTMDDIVNPPQEGLVTSQATPNSTESFTRVSDSSSQQSPSQEGLVTSQTTPKASSSQGSQTVTRMADLDQRLRELVQRVYGLNGSLENQEPPV